MGSSTKSLEATIIFFVGLSSLIITTRALQAGKYQSHIDFVATHNAIRAEVGVGPLSWNKTLATYARNYANSKIENCEMEHSGGPYGENLAEGYGHMSGEEAVKFWATEKANYDYASNKCVNDECGHYTQVVWRNSVHLGCARAKCRNGWMFVICSYDPPGNYEGERPY